MTGSKGIGEERERERGKGKVKGRGDTTGSESRGECK